jgi:hypothetical protein
LTVVTFAVKDVSVLINPKLNAWVAVPI